MGESIAVKPAGVRRRRRLAGAVLPLTSLIFMAAAGGAQAQEVIDGGAVVTVPGDHASPWDIADTLIVGQTGLGDLIVETGGVVTSAGGVIGDEAAGDGLVTVSDAGSRWTAGALTVGYEGWAALGIFDGGLVESLDAVVGDQLFSLGDVLIEGAGSAWAVDGALTLGREGEAYLQILDGGQLTAGDVVFGELFDGTGEALLSGTGSRLDADSLVIGEEGIASLAVSDGAVLSVGGGAGTIVLGQTVDGEGILSIGGDCGCGPGAPDAPGTIDAALIQFGDGAGELGFNHTAADYVFDAEIAGAGLLSFYSGTTTLTADSSGFAGFAGVLGSGGPDLTHLIVDGVLGGDPSTAEGAVLVLDGGVVSGAGTITGPVLVGPDGVLRGVSGQTLTMGGLLLDVDAILEVDLGDPSAPALFDVVTDVELDGVLDLTAAPAFGPGVSRILSYGGSLADHGLDIGATPVGVDPLDLAVQTAVAGQVNLVSGVGVGDLVFWDGGDAGLHDDGAVDGGDGVWSATDPNWTDVTGSSNGAMSPQPGFAIFQAAPGTVTVDDSAGAVSVTGMQFAADGYVVTGDAIGLTGADSVIRVGDGTADGAGFTATVASALTGAGGLRKTDLGTLVLTGDSSGFTGLAQVEAGHLAVDGVLGGDVVLAAGSLGGPGSILGGVSVTGGALIGVQGQTLTMGALSLASGATIDATLGAPGGDVLFDVAGDLVLDGTVDVTDGGGFGPGVYGLISYGGTLTDNGLDIGATPAGVLMAVQTSAAGHVYLAATDQDLLFWDGGDPGAHNNGAVDGGDGVWTAASPTWTDMDGLVNGPMTPQPGFAVFQAAPGTVTLDDSAGALAVTGMQFAVDGYRLEGDALELADAQTIIRVGDGTAAGADFMAVIASQITGAGALVKTDLGTLELTGDSSAFGGGTFVNEGLLLVNGSLGGLVTVEAGGAVGGSGQFGSITLGDGAVVSPGNSIGTLNLAGDIVFNAGSVYEVEVDPGGTASDLIHAGGTATLGDATVQHIGLTGDYAPFQTYTILTADGGLIGTFGTVTSDFAFLDPSLTYDANNVYLTLVRNDATFAGVGGTPNQIATGTAVEPLGFGNPIWDAAIMLSVPAARDAFDQLSGEIHASAHTAAIGQGDRLNRMLVNQVRLDRAPDQGVGLWAQAWGALERIDPDGNAAGLRQQGAGLLIGAEGRLGAGWTVGVAAGAETGDLRSLARRSEGESDTVHLAAYAGGAVGPIGLRFGAAHSRHQFDIDRTVDIPGFSDALAAEYDATSTQLFAEGGYAVRWDATEVEPFVAVAHIDLDVDGFSETGGAAALTARAEDQQVTLATLGVGLARDFDNGAGREARLHGRAGWRHAAGDVTPRTRFTLAGGAPFAIAGAPLAEDALVAELGLDVRTGALSAGVVWSAQAGGGAESHSLQGRLSWSF